MNREEAIKYAKENILAYTSEMAEFKAMAIETLEQTRWIPVSERLPDNAQHKGVFCPKYQVMTKYGVTEGWYNPDYQSWYVLLWFMTK